MNKRKHFISALSLAMMVAFTASDVVAAETAEAPFFSTSTPASMQVSHELIAFHAAQPGVRRRVRRRTRRRVHRREAAMNLAPQQSAATSYPLA
jgi:hypothetical protein